MGQTPAMTVFREFLAHLSTKCSWKAIVVSGCPSSVAVGRVSTFDVYTLETTFVTRFWWNLVRKFVFTISRPSSKICHVWSKTRSPVQILGNSCLHSKGQICNPILMKLDENVCLSNVLRPSLNMGHVGLTSWSPGQILENYFTNITFTF